MTLFITKVWGFDNPCGPLVFNSLGWRANAVEQLRPGDRVILVGTMGEDTAPENHNRVMGMMEPSTEPVAAIDFIVPDQSNRRFFREDGSYRWPFGLLNFRAWEFEPGLLLADAAPREGNAFGSAAAAGIVPLTAEEERRVLAHPHAEVQLLTSLRTNTRLFGEDEARRRNAPPPTEGARRGIMHMRKGMAHVYWFQLAIDDQIVGHKIGWAFDFRQRLRQFRAVSIAALGGLQYEAHRFQPLESAKLAFKVEQGILRTFDPHRHRANREVLTGIQVTAVQEVWDRFMRDALLGRL
ncbi:MAG: hypothetical protein P4M05_16625 [Bradyrhizobium sp.]|nr:hypothetical protein [Bradyrhizobium sp.]